jgi:hypothetical protein
MPETATALDVQIRDARARLDAHVRKIVKWHFDPATGCPFWLDYASKLDFDPRDVVGEYDDLKKLGHFQDEWLRGGPVRRWIPNGLADKPFYVFETGGSTGVPKSRVNIEDFQRDYEIFADQLDDATFPKGSNWLMLGPTGPRRLRLAIEHLAQHRGGTAFFVDLDPRWVNKLIRMGRHQDVDLYKEHVIAQALTILRAHDDIHCIFTTPKLLEGLAMKIDLVKQGITGVFCGGTEMNRQFHRFAREELIPGIDFVPTYGNTLMGLARPKPFDPADDYAIVYYPPAPRAVFEIVDPDDLDRTVPYGERGRVLLTTLTKEFFMPRFAERDEGTRAAPCDVYPWDGVADLGLLTALQSSVVVGVY